MMWGKHKENGLWISKCSDWRWLFRGHDALYIAAGRLRFRLIKPSSVQLFGWGFWVVVSPFLLVAGVEIVGATVEHFTP